MKKLILTVVGSLFLLSGTVCAQDGNVTAAAQKVFEVKNPDLGLSPLTGMTREHWHDAARYMLEGAFSYIHSLDDPMKFPKQPGVSYPRNEGQVPTEKLEGLCRTLFVAVPLLKENPELELNGIKVADYYRHQIGLLIDPNSPSYIKPRAKNGGPSQNLVEFGALAVSLFAVPEVLWEPLDKGQKDALAAVMISYGDGPTVPSNWKFFNIFVLSFFDSQGYAVNEALLVEYLQKSLGDYRGEGWYNDNPAYDYYSMWAFQMYGTLWSQFYGKQHYPEYAKQFKANLDDLNGNYPYLFSQNGEMVMWGRSICYRFGAIVPFPLMGFENNPDVNYGWMRRIASGTLLQFLQNPGFMQDNVPTLGFYGPFEPAVQMYSCRGSVFWTGKAFLGLLIPKDSPFWTATENNGAWDTELLKGKVYNKYQKGSEILITDYPNIGASEVRAWCKERVASDWQKFRSTENYNRLAYNSAFHWQADGSNGEVAMNYVVKNRDAKWEALRLFTFKKYDDGVYYRDAELETNANVKFRLADIPLANGILRVDKAMGPDTFDVRLGHYALPRLEGGIKTEVRRVKGHEVKIIDNGKYQLAMISYSGNMSTGFVGAKGLHPVGDESMVINGADRYIPASNGKLYVTLMLWKRSGEKWRNKELMPIKKLEPSKVDNGIVLHLSNNDVKTVRFD